MKLIVLPDDGLPPILRAIKRATKSIDLVIFRSDVPKLEKALKKAQSRGVAVRALVAHTNRGGDRHLRKLERRMLAAGVSVTRTDDDLVRYHGKLLIIDAAYLFVMGFNYTKLDIEKSRSFGVVTRNRKLIAEAMTLLDADANRKDFSPTPDGLIVSPENARRRLSTFIRKARRELLIYDPNVSDDGMIALLKQRAGQGVQIRILGGLEKKWRGSDLYVRAFRGRLHVRAIVRDRRRAFVGSQSLRKLELDERREVGITLRDRRVVRQLVEVFRRDWKLAGTTSEGTPGRGKPGRRKPAGDKPVRQKPARDTRGG